MVHDSFEPCDGNGTLGSRIGFGVIGLTQDSSNLATFGLNIPTYHTYVAVMRSTDGCSGDCSGYIWFARAEGGGIEITAQFPHIVDEGTGGTLSFTFTLHPSPLHPFTLYPLLTVYF